MSFFVVYRFILLLLECNKFFYVPHAIIYLSNPKFSHVVIDIVQIVLKESLGILSTLNLTPKIMFFMSSTNQPTLCIANDCDQTIANDRVNRKKLIKQYMMFYFL